MPRKPLSEFVKECRDLDNPEVLPFPDQFARYVDGLQREDNPSEESPNGDSDAFVTASGLMFLYPTR